MDVSVNLTELIFSANFVKISTYFHKKFQIILYNARKQDIYSVLLWQNGDQKL